MLVNFALAASNLAGFYPLRTAYYLSQTSSPSRKVHSYYNVAAVSSVILASTLMHASETKHRLPGLPGFRQYANHFLWFDRSVAVTVGTYCAYRLLKQKRRDWKIIGYAVFGLALMIVGELIPSPWFAPLHIAWHLVVYDVLDQVVILGWPK